MLHAMRTVAFVVLIFSIATVNAQSPCSSAAKSDKAAKLHTAQVNALAFVAAPMDSGVPAELAPKLNHLKTAMAEATDAELECESLTAPTTQIGVRLNSFLRKAAPGIQIPKKPKFDDDDDDSFKPVKGQYGNEIKAKVTAVSESPRLLEVTLSSDVTCGTDSQLLIYEEKDGYWRRALRWSSNFGDSEGSGNGWVASEGGAWGDFFITRVLKADPTHPEQWRAVVAHGTPWCQSRFSGFGLAVLAPDVSTGEGRVIWQTDRAYSRADFDPTLKALNDTFELRLHADEMSFDPYGAHEAFEHLVVYRYRIQNDKLTRIEPIAANARGFVEEWLEMPWEEALEQSDSTQATSLQTIHKLYEESYKGNSNDYTNWQSGPVQACSAKDRFQVTMTTQNNKIVPGKPGGESTPGPTYYFQLQQDNGYRLLSITTKPNPACTGPDLMRKAAR